MISMHCASCTLRTEDINAAIDWLLQDKDEQTIHATYIMAHREQHAYHPLAYPFATLSYSARVTCDILIAARALLFEESSL